MAGLTFNIAATLEKGGFAQAAEAVRGVGTASGEATAALEGMATAVETVNTAVQGFLAFQVIQFLKDIVNGEVEAEKNEQRLKLAVDNTGVSYEGNKTRINNYLQAIQSLTGANKEDLVPVLTILTTKLHDVQKSQENLNLVVGVSRGLNMDYVSAANLVAGVIKDQPRALLMASKAMGLDSSEKKNASLVLKELTDNYIKFADKQSALTKSTADMANTWKAFKLELGEGVGPMFVVIGDVALRVLNAILSLAHVIVNDVAIAVNQALMLLLSPFTYVSTSIKKLYYDIQAANASLVMGARKAGEDFANAFTIKPGVTEADLKKNLADPSKKIYSEMNASQIALLSAGNLAAAKSAQDQLKYKIEQINQELEAKKLALKEEDNFSNLSRENQNKLNAALQNEANEKIRMAQLQFDQKTYLDDKALMDSKIALTRSGTYENFKLRTQEIEMERTAELKQAQDSLLTAEELARKKAIIENKYAAEKIKISLDYNQQIMSMSYQAANAIGTATGQMLMGQQDAWKAALANIIQMIFNTAAKAIVANYTQGASTYVAQGGYAGIALGAGLMAIGAGVAAALTSSSTSPSSSSIPTTNIGPASAPVSASASNGSAQAQAPININIQGDMISDTAFIDRLTQRISSAVNNRDVRLVATQLSTTPGGH